MHRSQESSPGRVQKDSRVLSLVSPGSRVHLHSASLGGSGSETDSTQLDWESGMSALVSEWPSAALKQDIAETDLAIREGRFQRWLALIAGSASALSGLEVAYEHYHGSYSGALVVGGVASFFSGRAARTVLRYVSLATLADSAVGFCFHVRGIQRKPGGWRLPVVNMVMGPPVFAPLLFGISAYLGSGLIN